MKPLLLLACVMLVSAACGSNDKKVNPLAPSSVSVSVIGCDHASAESEVFTEIRGGRGELECGDFWGY